jgi:hypothetical protein
LRAAARCGALAKYLPPDPPILLTNRFQRAYWEIENDELRADPGQPAVGFIIAQNGQLRLAD